MSTYLYQDFKDFIAALNNAKVEYMLIGGYAVLHYGYARTTGDMDIWVNRTLENYKKIQTAFLEFGMPLFDMTTENFLDDEKFDVFTFGVSPVSIDVLTVVKGLDFESARENIVIRLFDNTPVCIIGKEDLIKAKKASGRPRDIDDIDHLTSG